MTFSKRSLAAAALAAATIAAPAQAAPACEPGDGGITLPPGFCAVLAADGLGAARHIAVAPNGDVYVALQGTAAAGGVVALRDADGDGKFEMKEKFGEGSLTGIGLRNGYLYVAGPNTVQRWKLTSGQLKPAGAAETVVTGLPGVRQHGDKGLTFDGQGSFYVNVGAPSNACQTRDRQKGSPGQDPARSSRRMPGSGSSTRTNSARSRKTVSGSPPGCGRCRRSPGTTARCSSR